MRYLTIFLTLTVAILAGLIIKQNSHYLYSLPGLVSFKPLSITKELRPNTETTASATFERPNLNADEKIALTPPAQNASEEEKKRHFDIAVKLALQTDNLDLTNCNSGPVVLKVKQKQNLMLVNKGSVKRVMIFDEKLQFEIPEKSQKQIVVDFGHGPGLYGYGCDLIPNTSGLILVSE